MPCFPSKPEVVYLFIDIIKIYNRCLQIFVDVPTVGKTLRPP